MESQIPEVIERSLGTIFSQYDTDPAKIQDLLRNLRSRHGFWRGKIKELPLAVIRPAGIAIIGDLIPKAFGKVDIIPFGSGPGVYSRLPITKSIILDMHRLNKVSCEQHQIIAYAGATLSDLKSKLRSCHCRLHELVSDAKITVGDYLMDKVLHKHKFRAHLNVLIETFIMVGVDGNEEQIDMTNALERFNSGQGDCNDCNFC